MFHVHERGGQPSKAGPSLAVDSKVRSRLNYALYVRDRIGLPAGLAPDLPPRLVPHVPVSPGLQDFRDKELAAQWQYWWRQLAGKPSPSSPERRGGRSRGSQAMGIGADYFGQISNLFDPPAFDSLVSHADLRRLLVEVYKESENWFNEIVKTAGKIYPSGQFRAWPLIMSAAERASGETGAPVNNLRASIRIIGVEGEWSYVFGPGQSCCSTRAFHDPTHFEDLVYKTFLSIQR
jgi:hypothetical protein